MTKDLLIMIMDTCCIKHAKTKLEAYIYNVQATIHKAQVDLSNHKKAATGKINFTVQLLHKVSRRL